MGGLGGGSRSLDWQPDDSSQPLGDGLHLPSDDFVFLLSILTY
jgi:hypothetical protein